MSLDVLKRRLRERATRLAAEASRDALDGARRALERQVADLVHEAFRLERDRRAFAIADAALLPALRALADRLAPGTGLTVEPAPGGLRVGALHGGERVSAVADLARVALAGGRVEVEVRAPQALAPASRPAAHLLAGLVARLHGGRWPGLDRLSAPPPSLLAWEGRAATLRAARDPRGRLPAALARRGATAAVTRAPGWTTFTLDRDGALEHLAPFLGRAVAAATGPSILRLLDREAPEDPPADGA